MSDHAIEPQFESVSGELNTAEFSLAFASSWIHERLGKAPQEVTGYNDYADCNFLLADLVERCIVFGSDQYDAVSAHLQQISEKHSNWARYEIIVMRA